MNEIRPRHWLGPRAANDDRIAERLLTRLPYPAFEPAEQRATMDAREAHDSALDDAADIDEAFTEAGHAAVEWICVLGTAVVIGMLAWGAL